MDFTRAKQENTPFPCFHSDKTWFFDQSQHAQGPSYINEQLFTEVVVASGGYLHYIALYSIPLHYVFHISNFPFGVW